MAPHALPRALQRVPCLAQQPICDLGRLEVHCQFARREIEGAFELIAAHFARPRVPHAALGQIFRPFWRDDLGTALRTLICCSLLHCHRTLPRRPQHRQRIRLLWAKRIKTAALSLAALHNRKIGRRAHGLFVCPALSGIATVPKGGLNWRPRPNMAPAPHRPFHLIAGKRGASDRCRLFVIRSQHLSGLWIDQVDPRASDAGQRLESVVVGWVVRNVALHVKSRRRASI